MLFRVLICLTSPFLLPVQMKTMQNRPHKSTTAPIISMKAEGPFASRNHFTFTAQPHLLGKGSERLVEHKYLIIHKSLRPVTFSLRCEQLAAKFRPDVALKMSTDL